MEEILSSIRRIISEDDTGSPPNPPAAEASPAMVTGAVEPNGAAMASPAAGAAETPVSTGASTGAPTEVEAEASIKLEPMAAANGAGEQAPSIQSPGAEGFPQPQPGIPEPDFSQPEYSQPGISQPEVPEPAAPPAPEAAFAPLSPPPTESVAESVAKLVSESVAEPLALNEPFSGNPASGFAAGTGFGGVPGQETEEEVLDLTEMVASDGRVVKITPQGPGDAAFADGAVSQYGLDHDYQDSSPQLTGGPAAFGASFGQAAQAETDGVDEVSYAEADLNGTPAYMAATETGAAEYPPANLPAGQTGQAPQEAVNDLQPAEPAADAFADLAGTEEQGSDEAMTQNPSDNNAGAQPAFGAGAFNGTETGTETGTGTGLDAGLDAMVQNMAEPMIRQWIDQNMSEMVKVIVRDEVARRLSGGS